MRGGGREPISGVEYRIYKEGTCDRLPVTSTVDTLFIFQLAVVLALCMPYHTCDITNSFPRPTAAATPLLYTISTPLLPPVFAYFTSKLVDIYFQ